MNTSARAVVAPSAELPTVLSKITRADMSLDLPRLDDTCMEDGHLIPTRKAKLDENIAKYAYAYDLGGRIFSVKTVKGKGDEPGVRFVGKFRAHINPDLGGKWFVSSRCHVPKFFEEIMYGQVLEAQKDNPDATVDFLIRVGIKPPKPGKPSAVGYEWTVDTLISMDVSEDPVAKMFERTQQPAALTAPPNGAAGQSDPVPESAPVASSEPVSGEEPQARAGRRGK